MLEIIIDNRDGNMWDVSGIASQVTYKTTRYGKASTFELTLVKGGLYESPGFKVTTGDVIRVRHEDGLNIFYGYVFVIDSGRDEEVKITAYDQLRYLMANDSYIFKQPVTATKIIEQIAADFQLKVGTLTDTAYKIPKLIETNQKLLDIICKALSLTVMSSGKSFVLFDNFGELELRNSQEEMRLDFSLGDTSLVYNYRTKRSIENAANVIKLAKDDKKAGVRRVFQTPPVNSISKWGRLQYYATVDEDMNEAQINEKLKTLLSLKNREQVTFEVDAIGDWRIRAGYYISVNIEELDVNRYFLVNTCDHKLQGNDHTMTLELRGVIGNELTGDY